MVPHAMDFEGGRYRATVVRVKNVKKVPHAVVNYDDTSLLPHKFVDVKLDELEPLAESQQMLGSPAKARCMCACACLFMRARVCACLVWLVCACVRVCVCVCA